MMTCDPTQTDPAGATLGVTPGTLGLRTGPYAPAWYSQGTGAANPDSFKTFLRTMATDRWIKVLPPKDPNGSSTIIDRVWGTRIIDPDHDYILIWAGGHSSHGGTDVARYDIGNNRWYIDNYGDWPMEGTYTNTTYPVYFTFNNRPFMTGHTYDNYNYDVHLKKMVLVKQKYTYTYDPVKKDWDSLRILNHAEMAGGFYNTSVTSTPYGVVCWTYKTGQSSSTAPYELFLLDSTSHMWKKLNTTGDVVPVYNTDFDGAVWDSKRGRLLFHTTNTTNMYSLNIQTLAFTKLNPTGSIGSDGYFRESAYLPAQDKVLIQGDRYYNCATNAWEPTGFTKAAGVGTTSDVNSGYMYDAKRDLIWDCQNPDLYVLRVSGGYDPNTLPGLNVTVTPKTAQPFFSAAPNPSSGLVSIGLFMPGKNSVTLKVYSLDGRLIKTLAKERVIQGVQSFFWNGSDSRNLKAPAGIYVCRMSTGKITREIKIVALR
jgi:hypothetical protein